MANIDGIRRPASRDSSRFAGRPARAPQQPAARNRQRPVRKASLPQPAAPQRSIAERKRMLYAFVGVALIGVVGLWYLGLQRTFSQGSADGGFFDSIVRQIQAVFTDAVDTFSDDNTPADGITNAAVEKLEGEVFPDIPTLND